LTDAARRHWRKWRAEHLAAGHAVDAAGHPMANFEADAAFAEHPVASPSERNEYHDTIGAIALDAHGTLAAACSTSGLPWKIPGRVGDSPIVGHGLYCDPGVGACVATGHGELVSGVCGAFLAVESLARGTRPIDAAMLVLRRIADRFALTERDQIGLIVIDAAGEYGSASLRPGFRVACRTQAGASLLEPESVLLGE
jgi:N4-(beta-N-acetylglucosaminyl)-L-asparaginase